MCGVHMQFLIISASKREPSTVRRRSQQKCNISISMKYASNIVRPPPLPPLGDSQTTAEVVQHTHTYTSHVCECGFSEVHIRIFVQRKKYQVMFQLLQSEAGFLTSLKIAIEVCPNDQLITNLCTSLLCHYDSCHIQ